MRERKERSNKDGDLCGGGSLLSHVISQELAGALGSYFLTVKKQLSAPPPQLRQWPLPSFFLLDPYVLPHTPILHTFSVVFWKGFSTQRLILFRKATGIYGLWKAIFFSNDCTWGQKQDQHTHTQETHKPSYDVGDSCVTAYKWARVKQERTWQDICPQFPWRDGPWQKYCPLLYSTSL